LPDGGFDCSDRNRESQAKQEIRTQIQSSFAGSSGKPRRLSDGLLPSVFSGAFASKWNLDGGTMSLDRDRIESSPVEIILR